uniref:Uncharacterized protein n=1 Tax=Avena sativa TaxID=4498 RepID=A0ACD5WYP2_AVESA
MASRDFLGVFGGGGSGGKGAPLEEGRSTEGGESDEIELGLGLSLGGRFGTDRSPDAKRPRLARSTSIASACSVSLGDGDGDGDGDPSPASPLQLLRTSSLPTDTEEERWRRREMQSRRRLEARRKMLGRRSSVGSSSLPGKPAKEDGGDVVNGLQLRRSTGSQGSTSANKQEQGVDRSAISQSADARSSTSENTKQNDMTPPATVAAGRPPNSATPEQPPLRTLGSLTTMRTNSTSDMKKSMMEDMPMVSSKIEGPGGKKIDGFLYRYRKGGEGVRIVCVCHGSFLTPAEFVKHAGGGDVSNPLRHIVVNPTPSTFL